jgi:hypothetical protein
MTMSSFFSSFLTVVHGDGPESKPADEEQQPEKPQEEAEPEEEEAAKEKAAEEEEEEPQDVSGLGSQPVK